jgi:hypothetical protein
MTRSGRTRVEEVLDRGRSGSDHADGNGAMFRRSLQGRHERCTGKESLLEDRQDAQRLGIADPRGSASNTQPPVKFGS